MLGPILLIVIGILFLLNNMYPGVFRFGKMWPVILIVIGLAKVFEYLQGTPEKPENQPVDNPVGNPIDKKEGQ
jgi:cell wall-active antibiotic response 4TMS protein YvqF